MLMLKVSDCVGTLLHETNIVATADAERAKIGNEELEELVRELSDREARGSLDGFGLYLLGVMYKQQDLRSKALKKLLLSVKAYVASIQ